jgi:anti-sigma factor RsiW
MPMNDDDLDPLHELASAYLDGDISPTERARVEASPELVALVEAFRQVRSELSDVPVAAADTRDAALAAALGEFDGMQSQGGPAPTTQGFAVSPVVSLAERRRWPVAVLSVAAAVLLLGVVGIAVLNGRGSDDKSSSAATDAASSQMMPADSLATESVGDGADSKAPVSTIGSITGAGAQVSMLIETPEQLLALQAPSDRTLNPLPATPLTIATEADTAAPSGGAPEQSGTTLAASNFSSSPAISCLSPQQIFLADIQYQGVFGIAARDTVTGVTQAIADDCTVLVSVGP